MEQEPKSQRERAANLISRLATVLVPDWRPTWRQAVWAIGIILALTVVALLGVALWVVLGIYINPRTATERKDLVQSFAIVVAGVVGSLSALAAVGNLYFSRRNLQQQRELELQRAQEDALPRYLDQMVQLLNDKDRPLRQAKGGDEMSILARVRTLTVLPRLDGSRKASVVQFLYESGLIYKERTLLNEANLLERQHNIVSLKQADVSEANLRMARLHRADLSFTNLRKANLSYTDLAEADLGWTNLEEANLISAFLMGANLEYANLSAANLSLALLSDTYLNSAYLGGANLSGANLSWTDLKETRGWTQEQLAAAKSLEGATMPDGQILKSDDNPDWPTFEDWLKDKESRKEDVENE
jgi:uncharacterized protein YjbI with pentapeptide repeats